MKFSWVGATVQYKSYARLLRLGHAAVDCVFSFVLGDAFDKLARFLGMPGGITDPRDIERAIKLAKIDDTKNMKNNYTNKDLFAHTQEELGNRWLNPDNHFIPDGDKIKGLRLRTNLFPTRTLSNRHSANPKDRECRRCHKRPETTFHILQECEVLRQPRTERHNFVQKQVARLIREKNKNALVELERTFTSPDGVRLRPDIVVTEGSKVVIADVAITWDSNVSILEEKCRFKENKYRCLVPLFPGKEVILAGLAFGARSMTCRTTRTTLQAWGLSKSDVAWLSSRVLLGSLICLNRFSRLVVS